MEGSYLNYASLMSSAVQDATQKANLQRETFSSKLAKVGAEKSEVESLTNLAVMPFEAKVSKEGLSFLSKGIDRISGGKVTEFNDFINKKIGRVKTNAEKQLGKLKDKFKSKEEQEEEPEEETSESASGESGEVEPEPVETSADATDDIPMENLGEDELVNPSAETSSSQIAETSFGRQTLTFTEDPEYQSQLEGDENWNEVQGTQNSDVANGQASSDVAEQTASTEGDAVEGASSNAVATAGEDAGITAGETGAEAGGEIAGTIAGETAEAGAGAALMDNPFTFFIGLAMMIGGIVGGVEGSRSIKNPTPTPVAVPNVSTQFGM